MRLNLHQQHFWYYLNKKLCFHFNSHTHKCLYCYSSSLHWICTSNTFDITLIKGLYVHFNSGTHKWLYCIVLRSFVHSFFVHSFPRPLPSMIRLRIIQFISPRTAGTDKKARCHPHRGMIYRWYPQYQHSVDKRNPFRNVRQRASLHSEIYSAYRKTMKPTHITYTVRWLPQCRTQLFHSSVRTRREPFSAANDLPSLWLSC